MSAENLPNPELDAALDRLGSERLSDFGYSVLSAIKGHMERSAVLFNFSVVAMAKDELSEDTLEPPELLELPPEISEYTKTLLRRSAPPSWIYTAREMIDEEAEVNPLVLPLKHSIFFAKDWSVLRGLNTSISSKIVPAGVHEPVEFAHAVVSGKISQMNPRNN